MRLGSSLAVASLLSLAVAHSYLGERGLIGPLLRVQPFPALPVSEAFAKGTLRFAWHLTSLAWVAIAYLLVRGECSPLTVGVLLAASGALTHAFTRGRHLAWPVFMLGAVGALSAASDQAISVAIGVAAATVLAALSGLHVAWLCGMKWGLRSALPEVQGRRVFSPSAASTALVAMGLLAMAWLVLALAHVVSAPMPPGGLWAAGVATAFVFAARTVGDFRLAGLFKRVHGTSFARSDDLLFTPLCFALSVAVLLQLV